MDPDKDNETLFEELNRLLESDDELDEETMTRAEQIIETLGVNAHDSEGTSIFAFLCEREFDEPAFLILNHKDHRLDNDDIEWAYQVISSFKDRNQTALQWAIKKGLRNLALQLINYGKENLQAVDKDGKTLLMLAIENDLVDVIEQLIRNPSFTRLNKDEGEDFRNFTQNQNPKESHFNGETVYRVDIGLTKRMLEQCDNKGKNAILYAISSKNENILSMLLQELHTPENPLLTSQDHEEVVANLLSDTLILAARHNLSNEIIFKIIESEAYIDASEQRTGMNLLLLAAQSGNTKLYEYCFDSDLDPRSKNNKGENALVLAIKNGHDEAALNILNYKLYENQDTSELQQFLITEKDNTGKSALDYALQASYTPLIRKSLNLFKNQNITDINGRTPLMLAILYHLPEVANDIIDNKSRKRFIDVKDKDGNTPLHHAIQEGNIDLSLKLIRIADCSIVNKNGHSPLDLATDLKNKVTNMSVVVNLLTKKADQDPELGAFRAVANGGKAIDAKDPKNKLNASAVLYRKRSSRPSSPSGSSSPTSQRENMTPSPTPSGEKPPSRK